MASTMRIPTEFTAIDKFTSVVAKMASGVSSFTKAAGSAVQRVNSRIDQSFSKLGNLSQLLLGLSFAGIFSMAISDIKAYEDGLASFRTIVSDLSDNEFSKFQKQIGLVARETKKSTVDVVQSFEKIAGLNADFAKTETGLANVSKQAIILARASGDELGTSAENLVGIMNQYSLSADKAAMVSNVLAAGQAVGASSITQSAEAYKNFGSVAKGANITLEQSQGLIQTLGKYSLFGAEAGTKLRGVTLQLQKAGLGYKSGQFQINDALLDAQKKMSRLSTAKKKDAYLTKVFGAENITAGKILTNNIGVFNEFTKGVTGTNAAQEQAAIKSNTFSEKVNNLKDAFTTFVTTNDKANTGTSLFKDLLGFVANNLDKVIGFIAKVAIFVGVIKGITLAMSIASAVTAAYTAVTTWYAAAAVTAALGGASLAVSIWAVAWPILAVIAAIAAIIAVFYYWDEICAWFGKQWDAFVSWLGESWDSWMKYIVYAIAPVFLIFEYWDDICSWFSKQWEKFTSFIGNTWDGLTSWFEEFSFKDFFMDIGQSIINFLLFPLKGVLQLLSYLPGKIGNMAQKGLDAVNDFTNLKNYITVDEEKTPKKLNTPEQNNMNAMQENRLSGNIDINVKDKGGNVEKVGTSGFIGMQPSITPTMGAFGN